MTDEARAREYLRPQDEVVWRWSDDGEAVVWRNGMTVAFREEIAEVLEHLAPRGLPSFGAVVILLASTRNHWLSSGAATNLETALAMAPPVLLGQKKLLLPNVVSELNRVASLPEELRTPLAAKCAMAELALDEAPRTTPAEAANIVSAVRGGVRELFPSSHLIVESRGYGPAFRLRELRVLQLGLPRIDEAALRLLLATGLDALPKPAELELPHSAVAAQLISSLAGDEELAGVARVAKRLLSSASLPRRLSAAPEQELGGYSDIAARGSLDRLLISELAHDNLTLAVRVAMNEALYLRRESPPSRPHQHRAVLIDAGIRMWGVPRVFATAAALAFAATTAREGAMSAWRARGDKLAAVDLLSRAGLVDHLRALEPDRHSAAAIPEFLARAGGDSAEPVELVLLMTEDGLDDPAVQEALRRTAAPQLFLATVSRGGRFRMYERRPHGSQLIREATLELGEIGGDVSSLVDQSNRSQRKDLPAIFSVDPFPLLFPHVVHSTRSWHAGRWGSVAVTGDRRLLAWSGREHGARQIADKLPAGKVWWVGLPDADDRVAMVLGTSSKLHLVRTDRGGRHVEILPLRDAPPEALAVAAHQGVLFVIGRLQVGVMNLTTGAALETVKLSAFDMVRGGRFLMKSGRWQALAHDGHAARFEDVVPKRGAEQWPRLIGLFDQAGADGPIGVTELGLLFSTATGTVRRLRHELKGDVRLSWVAPDGCRIALEGSTPPRRIVADTQLLTVSYCAMDPVDDRVARSSRPVTLRQRFTAVGVTVFGHLALLSHRGPVIAFRPHQGLPVFHQAAESRAELRHVREFQPHAADFGYTLRTARWNDGSECWLDSRGLLHLRPAGRDVPETTLVLCEGELTGWSADGKLWGREYFVGQDERVVHTAGAQLAAFEATVSRFAAGIDSTSA